MTKRTAATARVLVAHDWLALSYLSLLSLLVLASPGATQARVLLRLALCAAVITGGAMVARVATELPVQLRLNVYRLALVLTTLDSYLMLRDLLPLVRSDSVDASLLALDRALLGFEPALWLERFNIAPVVEWFAFFYFSYFLICGIFVIGVLWLSPPSRHTSVFAIGSLMVMFIGHLGYLAVPGFGPVEHLKEAYAGPVQGGFFWNCVQSTVAAGGAQKDIFPSLHTALPTWFTLYSVYRSRDDKRWRVVAVVTGFFALNIIVSTMLLRWHYAIDVFAGLALASLAAFAAPRIAVWETKWRRARDLAPPWPCSAGEPGAGEPGAGEPGAGEWVVRGKAGPVGLVGSGTGIGR